MSEMWLVVGLVGVFFALFLGVVVVDDLLSDRKRAVRLLESQITSSADPAAIREKELAGNFWERVLAPILGAAGRVAKRVTPLGANERIAKKLLVAGSPPGWDAERVIAFKVLGFVGGLVGGLVAASLLGLSGFTSIVVAALFT